tara:strand:- start:84 stop:434 length:351 start_codon:yes stop_codon:yes gene_type:complete
MSEFFKAPTVRAAMAEIQELQEDIMSGIVSKGFKTHPNSEEGRRHISNMKKLLEKQKNFMFRLQLEKEDPDAIEMRKQIIESARFLGLQPGQDINSFFELMSQTLEKLENNLPKDS